MEMRGTRQKTEMSQCHVLCLTSSDLPSMAPLSSLQACGYERSRSRCHGSRWRSCLGWRITGASAWPGAPRAPPRVAGPMSASHVCRPDTPPLCPWALPLPLPRGILGREFHICWAIPGWTRPPQRHQGHGCQLRRGLPDPHPRPPLAPGFPAAPLHPHLYEEADSFLTLLRHCALRTPRVREGTLFPHSTW